MTQPSEAATPAQDGTTEPAEAMTPAQARALGWVESRGLRPQHPEGSQLVAPDLLATVPLRRSKAGWIPVGVFVALAASYAAATLLWPLDNVKPTVSNVTVAPENNAVTETVWPIDGSAALGIEGGPVTSSTTVETPMASITKVVSVMAILEALPLAVGEQGPSYSFTYEDSAQYWEYLQNDESALDVPVDGSLTEYQLIQGILLGSAGNYTDFLAEQIWASDEEYAAAANAWLDSAGITDITIVEPTGIDPGNTATPAALIQLASAALKHPVVAEIAAMKSVELPGAGLVENTNGIINDPGVVGLKTGTLDGWNLLSAKNITVGDKTIETYAVVLDQEDEDARNEASRALYAGLETALQPVTVVPAGTKFATVKTEWGASTTIVSDADAVVSIWRTPSEVSSTVKLGEDHTKDANAGTMTATGVLGNAEVALKLSATLEEPTPLWRLTHPLELFGLN